jgi:hypothetical protein
MDNKFPRQAYHALIEEQISANEQDADELMVQRLYDVPGIAQLVLDMMQHTHQRDVLAYHSAQLAEAIEKGVFTALDKSEGECAEMEAMQKECEIDDEQLDDPREIESYANASLDLMGARRS